MGVDDGRTGVHDERARADGRTRADERARAVDGRMRLRVTSHPVAGTTGSGLSRILSTGPMLRNTFVLPPDRQVGYLNASRADLLRLGALFRVAATSPHSAVHVPVPPGGRPTSSLGGESRPLPMLLAREDTGLRPSDWPDLRRAMRRASTPLTVTAPAARPPERPDDVRRRADRHPARFAEHAATIVITARAELLFWIGDWLTDVGDGVARDGHVHRHGESFLGDIVGFFDPEGTNRPMHAFCVVAVEPIFHRARWRRQRTPAG
ncbi:hypothetical protein ACFV0O_01895 [Kitasatospora sp. NPDC059577]|uniref:hypothetical protein n=1 Tax=Kitasatospora sp. NPDC059577 TaxID=3346873 RepID=UPI0036A52967